MRARNGFSSMSRWYARRKPSVSITAKRKRPSKERPGSTVDAVDVLHVPRAEPHHHPSGYTVGRRRHQQMHVIGHQEVGVDANGLTFRERSQGTRKHPIVAHGEEHCGPIDALQYDLHGEAGGDNARVPGLPIGRCLAGTDAPTIAGNRGTSPVSLLQTIARTCKALRRRGNPESSRR